jgi:hypothetical protein
LEEKKERRRKKILFNNIIYNGSKKLAVRYSSKKSKNPFFKLFCVFRKNDASHLGEHHHFRVLSVKPKQTAETQN